MYMFLVNVIKAEKSDKTFVCMWKN